MNVKWYEIFSGQRQLAAIGKYKNTLKKDVYTSIYKYVQKYAPVVYALAEQSTLSVNSSQPVTAQIKSLNSFE